MKTIIILGPFYYPSDNAASRRILGIAKSLKAAGFNVIIASGQMSKTQQKSKRHDGFDVFSLNERNSEHLPQWIRHLKYIFMGNKTVKWLDSLGFKPHSIILYSGYSPYLLRLIPWSKKNGVKLVFDAVEWYEPPSFIARFKPYHLNVEYALRFLLLRVNNIIAISSYFYDFYSKKSCRTIQIPPTLDVLNLKPKNYGRNKNDTLNLVYAGSPGNKDLLNNIIEAVLRLKSSGFLIQLNVAGVNKNDGKHYSAISNFKSGFVTDCVKFLGVLTNQATLELVKNSDYSVLLRNEARYSRAGFPTKFVESFAVGTPVIANLTSDLGHYLINGDTGIVCSDPTPEHLENAIKIAYEMEVSQHLKMRSNCHLVALNSFDYRVYTKMIADFMN